MKVKKDMQSIMNNDSAQLNMSYNEASSLADIFLWFGWVVTEHDTPTLKHLQNILCNNAQFKQQVSTRIMVNNHERSFIKGMCLLFQNDKEMSDAYMQDTAKMMVNAL